MIFSQRGTVLTASDAAAVTADFGAAVALSATGTVMVVGDSSVTTAGTERGAVYVLDWSGSAWVQRGSRIDGTVDYGAFGDAVAVSSDGLVIAVGAPSTGVGGSVYVYDWSGSAWVLRGSALSPADGAAGDSFGMSVALDGTGARLIVGAPYWEGGFTNEGAAYLYVWSSGWVQAYQWSGEETGAYFGLGVGVSANALQVVIGAAGKSFGFTNNGGVNTYTMTAPAAGWVLSSIGGWIYAPDAANSEFFGRGLALSTTGAKTLIMANSGAYELVRTAPDTFDTPVKQTFSPAPGFTSLGMSPDGLVMLVGDQSYTGAYSSQGGVYVYDIAPAATIVIQEITDGAAITSTPASNEWGGVLTSSAACSDTLAGLTYTMYLEAIGLGDTLAGSTNTTAALADSAALRDALQQAINQLVADTADGAGTFSLGVALTLVDIADAVVTQATACDSVALVAELIAALEVYSNASSYDITESGALSDAYAVRVKALVALLESAQAVDTNTVLVHIVQSVVDSAEGVAGITSTGSLLNALLTDSVLATIRLNIGGELFTGWVLNTDTLAPSEYQFADLQFNSACKHGNTYLLAADDGIYEFTDDAGVEAVMTYIKTGKTDLGSDMRKSVTDAYMVYSAGGQMTLKVTTSQNGALQTNNYALVPFDADETTAPRRIPVGKGLKSRYWQFELIGEDAGCTFDEIGMLPVVLSRRI